MRSSTGCRPDMGLERRLLLTRRPMSRNARPGAWRSTGAITRSDVDNDASPILIRKKLLVETGPVGRCGQARPWLRGRHERGCPRLRLTTARRPSFSRRRAWLSSAGSVHRPDARARGARSRAWQIPIYGESIFAVRQLWRRSRPTSRSARTCAVQTLWPVDAAGLWTTTRARPQTTNVRAVVAHSPWTTALRMTRFARTRLSSAPTGPATGKSFSGFRGEGARVAHATSIAPRAIASRSPVRAHR